MATLQIIGEDAHYPLELSQIGIGRVYDNEIAIDDEAVSAYHALITVVPCSTRKEKENNNEYIIEDLESTNKTFVNGKAVTKHKLKDGDIIRVGETRIKFSLKEYVAPQQEFQKTKKLN
ncbi:MAG: FHA domain-containing protein [Gammaproteobacteria bacterium]|nr:FHA domain-containing protein [Gammaproteobacteria bacterium]